MDVEKIKELIDDLAEYKNDGEFNRMLLELKILAYGRTYFSPHMLERATKICFYDYIQEILDNVFKPRPEDYKPSDYKFTPMESNSFVLEWLTKLLCKKVLEKKEITNLEIDYSQDVSTIIDLVRQAID